MDATDWAGVLLVVAMGLEHLRSRKLDETLAVRVEDKIERVDGELQAQTRRIDAAMRRLESLEGGES